MKTKFTPLATFFCLLLVWVAACKKDPDPTPKSAEKAISAFSFAGLNPAVNATIDGNTITATVPFGTALATLVPTITTSAKATVSPASGVAQNFTNPVTYTVTAEDGSTQMYTVTVSTQGVSIVSFAPTSGGAGTSVVINGSGFSNVSTDNKVTVNGVNANITASRADQITIQIPEKAGSGTIVVAVGNKQGTSGSAFSFQYQIGSNTTLFSSAGRAFQSTAVDPDDGTVYVSDRTNSAVIIIRPNGSAQAVTIRDISGVNHGALTGISFMKTGVGGEYNKMLIVTNEAKGIYYYALSRFVTGAPPQNAINSLQLNDAIYSTPTSIVGVSQSPTASAFMNGTYYMACFGNSTIVRSTRQNGVTQSPVIIGTPGSTGFNAGSVSSTNAKFNGVVGVFLKNNLLYVADESNHAIRTIDYNTGTVNTVAGNGSAGNAAGSFGATRFNLPSNIVVDNSGLVYVTDRGNSRLVVMDPRNQTSQTLLSGLNGPYGLSIDNNGTLYLGEWGQGTNRVLKLTVK